MGLNSYLHVSGLNPTHAYPNRKRISFLEFDFQINAMQHSENQIENFASKLVPKDHELILHSCKVLKYMKLTTAS